VRRGRRAHSDNEDSPRRRDAAVSRSARTALPGTLGTLMTRTIALGALLLSTLLIAAAYVGALVATVVPPWTPWALMIGTSTIMLATMVLGASRAGRGIGRLAVPFVAMFLVLLVGFGA